MRFGECLAYMYEGAGVSWEDDHEAVPGLSVPYGEACDVRMHADETCDVENDTPRCGECGGWFTRAWRVDGKVKCPHCGAEVKSDEA